MKLRANLEIIFSINILDVIFLLKKITQFKKKISSFIIMLSKYCPISHKKMD